MASIQEEASGKKGGEIRYLTPLNIDNTTVKKYCRFKKYGIKYFTIEVYLLQGVKQLKK